MRALQTQIEGLGIPCDFSYIPESLKDKEPESQAVEDYLKAQLPSLGKGRIEELRKTINAYYLSRFNRKRHKPRYGTINKGFTEQQLTAFLRAIDNPKMKLLFNYQAQLGLRVGEVCKLNVKDINLETRELIIKTEKSGQLDSLIIPLPLFRDTLEFIKSSSKPIEGCEGYIFYREAKFSSRKESYLEPNYVRNKFREYLEVAGLGDEVYAVSEERGERRTRRLHRLTTHSLRHYSITRFARNSNGNLILTSKFARHTSYSSTNTYINVDRKEIYNIIDNIAVSEVALLKKRLDK